MYAYKYSNLTKAERVHQRLEQVYLELQHLDHILGAQTYPWNVQVRMPQHGTNSGSYTAALTRLPEMLFSAFEISSISTVFRSHVKFEKPTHFIAIVPILTKQFCCDNMQVQHLGMDSRSFYNIIIIAPLQIRTKFCLAQHSAMTRCHISIYTYIRISL